MKAFRNWFLATPLLLITTLLIFPDANARDVNKNELRQCIDLKNDLEELDRRIEATSGTPERKNWVNLFNENVTTMNSTCGRITYQTCDAWDLQVNENTANAFYRTNCQGRRTLDVISTKSKRFASETYIPEGGSSNFATSTPDAAPQTTQVVDASGYGACYYSLGQYAQCDEPISASQCTQLFDDEYDSAQIFDDDIARFYEGSKCTRQNVLGTCLTSGKSTTYYGDAALESILLSLCEGGAFSPITGAEWISETPASAPAPARPPLPPDATPQERYRRCTEDFPALADAECLDELY